MARSILQAAVVHLLNEENEKAEALFHKFIVEKAKSIHESLRQGNSLMEGLDDQVDSEKYMGADDLGDEGDADVDAGAGDTDAAMADADAGLGDDMGGDDLGGDVGDDMGADDMDGEHSTDEKLDNIEDTLAQLQATFNDMMAKIDPSAAGDEFGDDDEFGADEGDDGDEGLDFGDDAADDSEGSDEGEDAPDNFDGGEDEDTVDEAEDLGDEDGDDLDDITESVIAELEKVSVSMSDGKEVGSAGKAVPGSDPKVLPQKTVNSREGAKPIAVKDEAHKGFERESAPSVRDMKKRRNTKAKADQFLEKVPANGDSSALINKDFAGLKK